MRDPRGAKFLPGSQQADSEARRRFTRDLIAHSFGEDEYTEGQQLFREGAVRNIRRTEQGNYAAMVVDGAPYSSVVGIVGSRVGPQIGTNCNCGETPGCAHAAR